MPEPEEVVSPCRQTLDRPCGTFRNEPPDFEPDPVARYDIPGRADIFPFPEDPSNDAQAKKTEDAPPPQTP